MDENESCYCHHDDTDEYHDCLDYMECEECPYYYADLDQVVQQMTSGYMLKIYYRDGHTEEHYCDYYKKKKMDY